MDKSSFQFADDRFADIQLLHYRLNGFHRLSGRQQALIYCLAQATLYGRDIVFDQFGKHNLRIRKVLEAVYAEYASLETPPAGFEEMTVYLKRVWFSNGIHHHYGCEKFVPGFSEDFLREAIHRIDISRLPLRDGETKAELCNEIFPVIFDPEVLPKRVNKADGEDLVRTSACNYYENVTQEEVERFYADKKSAGDKQRPLSYGLNSRLAKNKETGELEETVWRENGMYGKAIAKITHWLSEAMEYAENEEQKAVVALLIKYYRTGDLQDFDNYSIAWVKENRSTIDFINGFIEVYGDPLGLKASWEGIVEYKDVESTRRAQTISDHAQWFEDHSPVAKEFKKKQVRGVTANVVCAAMLGGDNYPASAIGINLPNADWIRAEHGSKSVTIGNLTEAYNQAAHGNGFKEEFVVDAETLALIEQYGDICDDLHTDLHECLGHGSGQLLPGTDPDALKAYGNTIEEARADLFGLYYMADNKMVELGLLPTESAYRAHYYTYLMNGIMTQLTRIKPLRQIEEAHMRNRALISRWVLRHSEGAVAMEQRDGKTFLVVRDYARVRQLFAVLLAEVQRIKSEGDYEAAKQLVETYGISVDPQLHEEVLQRFNQLNIAPYKGFVNPQLTPTRDENGRIVGVEVSYSESYVDQMMRYSQTYGTL